MRIRLKLSALRGIRPHEYAARLLLGGGVSALSAWMTHRYGPTIGGLLLAFPAIFPASATLLESHERQKKQRAGIPFSIRGRLAAAVDARGAALGSLGMAAFSLTAWLLLPKGHPAWVLALAVLFWLAVSVTAWRVREWAP